MLSRVTVRRPSRLTDIQKLRLPDGARVLVRPIRESDAPAFAHAYTRLSPESLRRRHLSAAYHLTPRELRHLTAVDHREHVAFVAIEPGTGNILGSARYFRFATRPSGAEMAIEVIDDWQRRGVGRFLLRRLSAHAKPHGVDTFTAVVALDNLPMQKALRHAITSTQADGAELEYVLDVDALGDRSAVSRSRPSAWMDRMRVRGRLATTRLPLTRPQPTPARP
jgi:GNAT superfamily N-acetyltransferase